MLGLSCKFSRDTRVCVSVCVCVCVWFVCGVCGVCVCVCWFVVCVCVCVCVCNNMTGPRFRDDNYYDQPNPHNYQFDLQTSTINTLVVHSQDFGCTMKGNHQLGRLYFHLKCQHLVFTGPFDYSFRNQICSRKNHLARNVKYHAMHES